MNKGFGIEMPSLEENKEYLKERKKRKKKIKIDKIIHKIEHKTLEELEKKRKGRIGESLGQLNEKYGKGWLERRGKLTADRSGISEAIEGLECEKIVIADICSGKQHINEAILESSKKNIEILGFDESDRATKEVSRSSEGDIESFYAIGENLPIKDEKVDVVKFDFSFQEANDEMTDKFLEEAKRILKDDGIITIIDDLPQEKFIDEKSAEIKSKTRNRRPVKLNLHSDEEWRKIFKKNELEVESFTIFGDDEENEKEQFISFVLKNKE
ncbi:methyltransferase domain-containing protein [Candidatus Parcubacteria bacterium]|nr:methyltransferase domain-containing protein [Candidatus Parcubacteria bacterium]